MTLKRVNLECSLLYSQILRVQELQKDAVCKIHSNEYEKLRVKEARLLRKLRQLRQQLQGEE